MKKSKFEVDWSINQPVSSWLALLLVAVLSLVVSWYSLNVADEIIKLAPNSTTFNVQKRLELYNEARASQGSAPVAGNIGVNNKTSSNKTKAVK